MPPEAPTAPISLDGRVFSDATPEPAGDVSSATEFRYHQDGDLVWASYSGGSVRLGYLVGLREGDTLRFRYTHLTHDGESSAGSCRSHIRLADGRVWLEESWQWESKPGTGTSLLVERA